MLNNILTLLLLLLIPFAFYDFTFLSYFPASSKTLYLYYTYTRLVSQIMNLSIHYGVLSILKSIILPG